jgi:hypothetical protein
MASLKRMICNGSFLKDISRTNNFNKCLNRYNDYGTCDHESGLIISMSCHIN